MKLTTINEALRFGNREAREVMKLASRIHIGIEYEFHVDDADSSEAADYDEEDYMDAINEYVSETMRREDVDLRDGFADSEEEHAREVLNDFENALQQTRSFVIEISGIDSTLTMLNVIDEYVDNTDIDDIGEDFSKVREYAAYLYEVNSQIEDKLRGLDRGEFDDSDRLVGDDQEVLVDLLEAADNMDVMDEPGDDLSDRELAEWLLDDGSVIVDEALEIVEWVDAVSSTFHKRPSQHVDDIIDELRDRSAEEDIDEIYNMMKGQSRDDYEDEVREEAYDNIDTGDYRIENEGDAVGIVINDFTDPNNQWGILWADFDKVITDPSVDEGAEAITNPLPLNHAFQVMEQVFQYIDDKGSTSENTGMHVNISIKGIDLRNLDKLKMIMLMDDEFVRDHKYPVRGYVSRMWDNNESSLTTLAMVYNNEGIPGMLKAADGVLIKNVKHQSVNFNPIGEINVALRRIELRYFGGNDYHFREAEMKKDILQAAYLIMASADPEFAQAAYASSLMRFLNRKTAQLTPYPDFLNMAQRIKSGQVYTATDFKTPKPNLP